MSAQKIFLKNPIFCYKSRVYSLKCDSKGSVAWVRWFGDGSAEPPNHPKFAKFGRTETEPKGSVVH